MNKVYRIIWNRTAGLWVVVSELVSAKGRRLAASPRREVPNGIALLVAGTAFGAAAQTVALPVFDPTVNDNTVGATVASGGATLTLQGPATQITPGITGRTVTALADLYAAGMTTDPRANPNDPASLVINTGARTQIISIPDPITGGTRNLAVYANPNIIDTHTTSNTFVYAVDVNGPTNGRQYINTRIGGVAASGGTLNVAIGSLGVPTDSAANFINMGMAKASALFYVDGAGAAASNLVWQGANKVDMGNVGGAINAAGPGPVQVTNTFQFHSYRGQFTAADGSSWNVTNAAQLQAYNTYLIGLLQSGSPNLNPNNYEAEFAKAFIAKAYSPITVTNGPPLPDEVYTAVGVRAVIRANGANATATIAPGARLDVLNATVDSRVVFVINSGAVLATNGGTAINRGQVSFQRGGNDNGAAMVILTGGHGFNGGVVNAGFLSGVAGAVDSLTPATQNFSTGIYANGAASTFQNEAAGIVNVAGPGGMGLQLINGSTGSNAGTLNVGIKAVSPTATSASSRTDGVRVASGAQFQNLAGGLIYLGRQPQYSSGAAAADIVNNATPLSGITVLDTGSATNAGTITLGRLVQGSSGILASGSTGAVVNSGVINVNGAASDSPTENQGINVVNATNVSNTGTINVSGIYGVGLKLLSTGTAAATSSGTINVTGAASPTGLRDYGIWSEGAGAMATLSGAVNLSGDGAIGVHARGDGDINVAGAGNVNFVSGANQIGYFLFGAGSTVTYSGSAGQNVSTLNSTLFRIEDGAVFNGGTSGSVFTASGQGATAFNITGAPSTFDSGNFTLNLSGESTQGVVIEGGAVGTITSNATINQTGVGSVAGIVDGQKHGLGGAPVGLPNAGTLLTSSATLNSSLDEVTGYIARNQGQLVNSGSLTFTGAHTTGIQVETGATATNSASISISDGGTGIVALGPAGGLQTTANNSGTISVMGGSMADRTRGVVADGPTAVANMLSGSTLGLVGVGAIGAAALSGGRVSVVASSTPVFGNVDQIAYHALGAGSEVVNTAVALDAYGVRSTLFRIEDGARLNTTSALSASGQGAAAIVSSGVGAQAALTGGSLDISGAGARGLIVEGGAQGLIGAGAAVTLSGDNAVVGIADGQKHDLAGAAVGAPDPTTLLTNQASMSLSGDAALAFIAQNQGRLLNQGSLEMTGADATGVHVLSGGVLDNQADITVANGTGIDMEGANSQVLNRASVIANDGVAALHVHDGGGGVVGGNFISDGTAHTVLIGGGASGLDASDVTLTSHGVGNGIENRAEIEAITLSNTTIQVAGGAGIRTATQLDPASTVTIAVSGAGRGLAFETAAGATASGDLDLGAGYVISGDGAGSTGILANTTGTVSTAARVDMTDPAAGAALVAGRTASTHNTGTLTSASTLAPVVDLSDGNGTTFSNSGVITAAGIARVAVQGSAAADRVDLAGGAVTGVVAMGDGRDELRWSAGSLNGALEMGDADDALTLSGVDLVTTYHVDGGVGTDVLTLDGIVHRGGSFAADDLAKGLNLGSAWETINLVGGTGFTLTDNLLLGGSTVNIEAGSTLYAGAGVHPIIDAPAGDAVTVNNGGTLDLTNGDTGPTDVLTINGNYVGQGGRLRLDTLTNEGGPRSTSDLLVTQTSLLGAGPTAIEVVYPAASGALTVGNGILLVDVAGQSDPEAFTLANRVVGGAYEYLLFQGGLASQGGDPADGNWYLRNVTNEVVPPEPPEPPEQPPSEPEPNPPEEEGPIIPILRPETAVYLANQAAAAGMFIHTLHDRLGEVDYTERQRNGSEDHRATWGRVVRNQFDSSVGEQNQVDAGTDTSIYQVGGELGSWRAGDQRTHWGLMGGYGQANTQAISKISGYSARGRVKGYHIGAYGTWYMTAAEATGAYVDGWLIYGEYNQSVHGTALPIERYDSNTVTGSLEAGYAFALGEGEENAWYIEPEAQLIYTAYSGGDHREVNGTVEQARDAGGLTTRLGARIYQRPIGTHFNRVQPFVELNWWHAGERNTVALNGRVESLNHGRDVYELKLGAQAELGGGWTGWGQMALRESSGDYRNVEGQLGVKYSW